MGFRRVTAAASAILLLAGAQVANARAETKTYTLEDALQVCLRVPSPTDRLACFEALARSSAPDASKTALGAEKAVPEALAIAPKPQVSGENDKSRYVVMRADDYKKEKRKTEKPNIRARTGLRRGRPARMGVRQWRITSSR